VTPLRIEKLQRSHKIDDFDCGRDALNRFLTRYAFQNQQAEASQTYVALADEKVAGYYTLVVGEVAFESAHERLTKGRAVHRGEHRPVFEILRRFEQRLDLGLTQNDGQLLLIAG
jgi:hypothetical protein